MKNYWLLRWTCVLRFEQKVGYEANDNPFH